MYKILNSMVAIVIVGAISTQISGMEEKQRVEKGQEKRAADPVALFADGAAKRPRVADELQTRVADQAAVTNAPERLIIKMEREDDTEVPMQPVITNSEILAEFGRLSSRVNVRFEELATILQAKFTETDTRLGALHSAVALMQGVTQGRVGASHAQAPARAQSKQDRLQVPMRLAPQGSAIANNAQAISYPAAIAKQNPAPTRSCTYTPTTDLLAHDGPVNYIYQTTDGYGNQGKDCMVSASTTCLKLWDDECDAKAIVEYPNLVNYVKCTHINGTDIFFMAGLSDNTIRNLSNKTAQLGVFKGHAGQVNSICHWLSGDGLQSYTVSGSSDTTIKIWHPDGSVIRTIAGHKGPVNALAILDLEKEKFIVSASADKTSRIWDIEGRQVGKLPDFTSPVTCLTTVGQYIVAGSFDGTVFLWNKRLGFGFPIKISNNEGMHSVKGFRYGQTHALIVTGSVSKIMIWLIELKFDGAFTLMQTINSEGSDIRSIDVRYDSKNNQYILAYGMSNGRIRKGVVKIS